MQSIAEEPELEQFVLRLVPSADKHWKGATEHEIDAIEKLAGQPLPRCYRWFLSRMGGDPGLLTYFRSHMASTVLACYHQERVEPEPDLLLIADEDDEFMSTFIYYGLDQRIRDDAMILSGSSDGGPLDRIFETFREMMAWHLLNDFRISSAGVQCDGFVRGDNTSEELSHIMKVLGFDAPIPTGQYCCIFERADAAMTCMVTPRKDHLGTLVFDIGGAQEGIIRSVLGSVATQTSLEIEIKSWVRPE